MTTGTWIRFGLACALLAASGCSCDEDVITPTPEPEECKLDFECETGFEFRQGECRESRCLQDGDCCPGQKCNASAGFCADQSIACTTDDDCDIEDQRCIEFRGGSYCGYPNAGRMLSEYGTQSCETDIQCPRGRSCFASRCVVFSPCEGGCPDGSVCDVDSNSCFELRPPGPDEDATESTCAQTCVEGTMLVLSDPDTMSGPVCCALDCECAILPPVVSGQSGWYADIAVSDTDIRVSAYDATYGDLIVATFDETGDRTRLDYVDGLPGSGDIVGDPNGPRAGRVDLGADVGQHTSVALASNGDVHVSYYDVEAGALRYANFSGGLWKTMVVDEEGDTGLYTSIAIGADDIPRISYMMAEGTVGGDPTTRTALKLATANNGTPGSASDWAIEVVDSAIKPEPICGGGCPQGRACVDVGNGATCVPTTSGCDMCGSDEACISVNNMPTCQAEISSATFDDLVEGTGLFSSLALTSTGSPMLAYYDRLRGDLRWAYRGAGGTFVTTTLDGNDPSDPTDVGQHANIAIAPDGTLGIAYVDATRDQLRYIDVATRTIEIVDTGVTPPDVRLVGADASLVFDGSSRPTVAYQDATNLDVIYARRLGSPPMWSNEVLLGGAQGAEGGIAAGFYVAQGHRGSLAYIANTAVTFNVDGDLLLDLTVITNPLD